MTGGEGTIFYFGLDCLGQIEEPQGIGTMASGFSDGVCESFLGLTEFVDKTTVGNCFLDGVEVLPLEIFDKCGGADF